LEECPVCHEVVGLNEAFLCICGDLSEEHLVTASTIR
jgi:hypothetical protein